MPGAGQATQILTALSRGGDRAAAERLLPLVYDELRALASEYMRRERPGHTLDPTALVHEAYLRMIDQRRATWNDRAHFIAVASEVIRRVLVDHARKHKALKRGGGRERDDLGEVATEPALDGVDLLALDEALNDLGELNERQRRVVELRYFGGLTVEDAARVLAVSPATVKADWHMARIWLRQLLEG
jgi:RNA polymerase sigma factor (TIGR02999 family)